MLGKAITSQVMALRSNNDKMGLIFGHYLNVYIRHAECKAMKQGVVKSAESFYSDIQMQRYVVEDASIAVRVVGEGPSIVFIHGYPVSGYTWRKLLSTLAETHTCYVIDLPGLGDSDWASETDFSFTAQARRLDLLFKQLELSDVAIVAHDTGATIARLVALLQGKNVSKLVIMNTEIPGHRPPWIQLYQLVARLPFSKSIFGPCMKSKWFLKSTFGLGQFYSDDRLFDVEDSIGSYITPLVSDGRRLDGALNYLKGIEWNVVDELQEKHKAIEADVLFLWGEDDKTFPVNLAQRMSTQFKSGVDFVRLASASLMPHEEQPGEILRYAVPFLNSKIKEQVTEQVNG